MLSGRLKDIGLIDETRRFKNLSPSRKGVVIGAWIGFGIGVAALLALASVVWLLPPMGVAVSSVVVIGCYTALGINTFLTLAALDLHLVRHFPPVVLGPIGLITSGIGVGIGWLMGRIMDACTAKKAAISTREVGSSLNDATLSVQAEANRPLLDFAPKPYTSAQSPNSAQKRKVIETPNSVTSASEDTFRRSAVY